MKILIKITDQTIQLLLMDKEGEIARSEWKEKNNLSETLLIQINELLQNNSLKFEDISNFSVSSDQSEGYTTTRIAKTVAETFNFARKNSSY